MIRVLMLGQGVVGTIFAVGLERIKRGELKPYGVPLADMPLKYGFKDIELVGSVEVDSRKTGKDVYQVATEFYGFGNVPESLRKVKVYKGVEMRSLKDLNIPVSSLDRELEFKEALDEFYSLYEKLKPDVIVDVCTTQKSSLVTDIRQVEEKIEKGGVGLVPSQVYAYLAFKYAERGRKIAYVNLIPVLLANSPGYVKMAEESSSLILGDDGATGATPLTADLLEHLKERNRFVRSITQFNIGGNMDFLALLNEERNRAKEATKSSIVKDILEYEAPHYIKPTGYLKPLGDKKFVAMHIEYVSFNGAVDEIFINMRVNDSPALAGYIVDLVRLAKLALENGFKGTIYEVNAFYMKRPGPISSPSTSRILAFNRLLEFIEKKLS
ncbi:MAG: myo-inositol-1-phosphate synthase [Thermoprotei archaeon]|nr:MAG: myo-inositol-1-phosphate synthase [Thermoprotei archaeon]